MVYFIVGDSRTGSTLLESYFTSIGLNSLGETHRINDLFNNRGVPFNNGMCDTCKRPFNECTYWSKYYSKSSPNLYFKVNTFQFLFNTFFNRYDKSRLKEVQLFFNRQIEENKNILDSSKRPYQVFMYYKALQNSVPMKFIFISRDLMGLTWSKMKRNDAPFLKALLSSIIININMRLVKNLLILKGESVSFIRYKDLCEGNIPIEIKKSSSSTIPHPLGGSPTRVHYDLASLSFDDSSKSNLSIIQYRLAALLNVLLNFEG